ncbi:hypothetical protein CA262_08090 [Sphingobium sp. GW456-12-10-14-TSB1]|uniref:hypothetical protein n=1 Tax=Sphingobium sp. GW456-12-10-14-TSB1 TaxID=1987165 RepID=UPI000A3D46AD|nr:hypothetical protein [Sphingobium sp. GW456-12-10-14-TSB1]OUC54819.1 hypothetical protein CA262_08090 [Sphingobium sp. GW456-12-10-14-TSB1]
MKTHAMASGLRITLSKTELQALLKVAQYGADRIAAAPCSYIRPKRQEVVAVDVIQGLERGLASVQWKKAEAKARREAPKREAERSAAREHHTRIDGYAVWGMLGDWTDISDDPDRRRWADMFHPDTSPREQGEIRHNVWRIFISKGNAALDDLVVLSGDCTMTADRDEIEQLARRIIANYQD